MPELARDPIFVGGTQRSGTHALGGLIGSHPAVARLPREMKFHAHPKGLPGVIGGKVSPRQFARRMRGRWWKRPYREGRTRGLYKTIPRDRFDGALGEFLFECRQARGPLGLRRRSADLVAPARKLTRALFDPLAAEHGGERWVEMSPRNAEHAPELLRMFPAMKLILTVRDGRDVAASLLGLPFGVDDPIEGLERWQHQVRRADAAARRIPASQLHVVRLEELLLTRREDAFEELLDFLGLDDDERMRATFDRELTAHNGHLGRWRVELPTRQRLRVERRYADLLAALERDGVVSRPAPDPLPPGWEPTPTDRAEPGSRIDPWADDRALDA